MDDKYSSSNSPLNNTTTNYAYSGKVMLISVIALFIFCFIFAAFHFYSRLFLMRRSANLRSHHQRLRRHSFSSSSAATNSYGLSPSALNSLPTFLFSVAAAGNEPPLECAVCLSEFLVNETGRVLPKCNHAFHVQCIDMWLVTHSSCPLCRAPIFQIALDPGLRVNPVESIVPVFEPGDSTGVSSSSSSPSSPQLLTVTVEVPGVNEGSGIGPTRESQLKTMDGPGPGPVRTLKRFLSI